MATTSVPVELNPFSHELHEDPYPVYAALRDQAPVYVNDEMGFYALTRYDDVSAAFKDHETFVSGHGTLLEMMDSGVDYEQALGQEPMILFLDPPYHDELRRLVTQAFTPRALARMEPYIRDLVDRLCDEIAERGGGDAVHDFAGPLPMHVIFEMMGVPEADREQLRVWIDRSLDRVPEPPHIPDSAIEAAGNNGAYTREHIRSQQGCPAEDLIGDLIRAEIPEGDGSSRQLTFGEIVGFVGLLGGAGNETITKLLSNTLVLLQRNPEARRRAIEDPVALRGAIEESLRYWAPAHYNGRTTTRDVTLHGKTIPAGSKVLLMIAAANRDERRFPEADVFDIDREDKEAHVAFGAGIHFCLGAQLARMQARIGLTAFLQRFPDYHIDEDRLERVHSANVQGFEHVPFSI